MSYYSVYSLALVAAVSSGWVVGRWLARIWFRARSALGAVLRRSRCHHRSWEWIRDFNLYEKVHHTKGYALWKCADCGKEREGCPRHASWKDCPHCEDDLELCMRSQSRTDATVLFVECAKCGAIGPCVSSRGPEDSELVRFYDGVTSTTRTRLEQRALDRWNEAARRSNVINNG